MPRRRRISLLALGAAAALGAPATAAALPDLVSDPPGSSYTERYEDGRLLLRFNGYVTNAPGVGPLEIRASQPDRPRGTMQRVEQWAGVTGPGVGGRRVDPPRGVAPTVIFENNDDHNHYHLKNATEYSLWAGDPATDRSAAQVALAQKTEAGFCIEDTDPSGGNYDINTHNFCWQNEDREGQSVLVMGISSGFRDVYPSTLSFQWVDVSRVAPGDYFLASRTDPENVLAEVSEGNNGYATRRATVPGHLAEPVTVEQTGGSVRVDLRSRSFGDAGPRRFRIVSGPSHGTLDRAVGEEFTEPTVTYTPDPGYLGTDTFSFAALHEYEGGVYPLDPAGAAVTVAGADVSVAISGAPPQLYAGTAAQLQATVANAPGGVTWRASAGTVTPDGLFTAPASPPPGGAVTVTATSAERPDVSASATIGVIAARRQAAAPSEGCAVVPPRRERGGGGTIRLSAEQLLVNQRISQAAVRRANAVQRWLDAGIEARDLCGGSIGPSKLGPGVVATTGSARAEVPTATPRPLPAAGAAREGGTGRVSLSRGQLLINQRVSQAAIRRLNALGARLNGGLTGGDLRPGAVELGRLVREISILRADASVEPPPPSVTSVAGARGARGASVRLSARQLRINQRISQAAVRRANALQDRLRAGLSGRHFRDGTIVARNLAPDARP